MKKYSRASAGTYLEELASRSPVPGGGSASALVAATGVACLEMAANFTIGKKGYEQNEPEIKKILSILRTARKKLLKLMDKDAVAYLGLSAAYKSPSDTAAKKKARQKKIQNALKAAMAVPLKIMEVSASLLPDARRLLGICNKNLVSDVGCGAAFLGAAIEAANLNVNINLKYITDREITSQKKLVTAVCLKAVETAAEIVRGIEG